MKFFKALTVLGELFLTAAVVMGLYAGWLVWGTSFNTHRAQDAASDALTSQWSKHTPNPVVSGNFVPGKDYADHTVYGDGDAMLKMRIPRLGSDWEWVMFNGTELSNLAKGPGHYINTASVGGVGNFASAGHRGGYAAPYEHLDLLQPCDKIIYETSNAVYTYMVLGAGDSQVPSCIPEQVRKTLVGDYRVVPGTTVVSPTDVTVVDPVPNSTQKATVPLTTLTTCNPQWGNYERLIVHGVLTNVESKKPEGGK